MRSRLLSVVVVGMAMALSTSADARVHEMKHGFVIPCEDELCRQMLFCWRGARYADLNQLTKRVTATATFDKPQDACVDSETDDVLSARSLIFGYGNETAADRLDKRVESDKGGFITTIYNYVFNKKDGNEDCQGNVCEMSFSPYGLSCVRLCSAMPQDGRHLKAEVYFTSESAIDRHALYMWLAGVALALAAPYLSRKTEMFYLTGGVLGVTFAVSLLVLLVSSMINRSSPTKTQWQLAGFFQVGALYMRTMFWRFFEQYSDWIALYVIATFLASLGLVHYFLKRDDGSVAVSKSLEDIVRIALQLLAAFVIAAPIPSARLRIVTAAAVFLTELISHMYDGGFYRIFVGTPTVVSLREPRMERRSTGRKTIRARTPEPQPRNISYRNTGDDYLVDARSPQREEAPAPAPRSLSGTRHLTQQEYDEIGRFYTEQQIKKLLTPNRDIPPEVLTPLNWLVENHHRILVRKDEDDDEEEDEEVESENSDEIDEEDDEEMDE